MDPDAFRQRLQAVLESTKVDADAVPGGKKPDVDRGSPSIAPAAPADARNSLLSPPSLEGKHPALPFQDSDLTTLDHMREFDVTAAQTRIERLWKLGAEFGMERSAVRVYLKEIVSDRYCLINGLQVLRDELQLAGHRSSRSGFISDDVNVCGADFSLPSVMTTLAHTNCGDRIHQGLATMQYRNLVAGRFAAVSEVGELKLEAFSPTGGGTDDGATLAHVTVAHQMDEPLKRRMYAGHPASFPLIAVDLMTHVGRDDFEGRTEFGITQESPWREPRRACGAIVGCLSSYDERNAVHRRIRSDLGEENFLFLTKNRIRAQDGTDATYAVAAAIVAVQGLLNTLTALRSELDERGVGHCTASVTVNIVSSEDTIIYLARGTVFRGEMCVQGCGTEAKKYRVKMIQHKAARRLVLEYDGCSMDDFPIRKSTYTYRKYLPSACH